MCDSFVDVHVLTAKCNLGRAVRRGQEVEVDPVAEQVVEVSRREREVRLDALFESGLKSAGFFRLETWIRKRRETSAIAERLGKCRLLDPSCVGEEQSRARKKLSAVEDTRSRLNPRNELVAKAFVVNVSSSRNERQPLEGEDLLAEHRMIAA